MSHGRPFPKTPIKSLVISRKLIAVSSRSIRTNGTCNRLRYPNISFSVIIFNASQPLPSTWTLIISPRHHYTRASSFPSTSSSAWNPCVSSYGPSKILLKLSACSLHCSSMPSPSPTGLFMLLATLASLTSSNRWTFSTTPPSLPQFPGLFTTSVPTTALPVFLQHCFPSNFRSTVSSLLS